MALLLCVCFCFMPCSVLAVSTSDAAEPISPERECTLTFSCVYDAIAFADVPVKLYRIADVSAKAEYTPVPAFLTAGLVLNGVQSAGEWDMIRSTLEAHILANAIEPDATAMTNPAGQVCFESLEPGMYLVISERVVQDGVQASFQSALVALPGLDEDGVWQYRIAVTPKPEVIPSSGSDTEEQYKILKLWKDGDNPAGRPRSIEAEIFRDGKSYQTVTLSEENQWSYTWTTAETGADWMVVERYIPEGYIVTVEERDTVFILTNTLHSEDLTDDEDAPQTGDISHIWLYTILMYASGIGLVLLGIAGKRNRT